MKCPYFAAIGLWTLSMTVCYADINAQSIALNCMTCHREMSKVAETEIPPLGRLSQQQLLQMLLDFKYDKTLASLMPRIAKGYSDEELSTVAAYLSRR